MSLFITVLNISGMACGAIGSYVLIKNLFITDREIEKLAELPIEASSTNYTSQEDPDRNKPAALIPPQALREYRKTFITGRKKERANGINGLRLLILGFVLQAASAILDYLC